MATSTLSPQPGGWKRLVIKAAAFGAGFAIMISLLAATVVWYESRPKPPQTWNTAAILVKDPPSFYLTGSGKALEFRYIVENTTNVDYQIVSKDRLKILVNTTEGAYSQPVPSESASLQLPIFIPAKQKAMVHLTVSGLSGLPEQRPGEKDSEVHERLRAYLEDQMDGVASFAIFEDSDHYQINLPRWLSKRPEATSDGGPFVGATKAYRGFTYTFDGAKWIKGEKAQKYTSATKDMEPWGDDQYDPLNLLSNEEKKKRLLTEKQIQRVAEQFTVSYEEALEDAKAQGYSVPTQH